jgi:hypothetical protein
VGSNLTEGGGFFPRKEPPPGRGKYPGAPPHPLKGKERKKQADRKVPDRPGVVKGERLQKKKTAHRWCFFDISVVKNLLTSGVTCENKAGKLPILTNVKCYSCLFYKFSSLFKMANFQRLQFMRCDLL